MSTDTLVLLIILGIGGAFALGCALTAFILWIRRPARHTTLRILLFLPLAGVVAGFPVGFLMDSWRGLHQATRFGAIVSLGCGNAVGGAIMLAGLLYLGIALLLRRKTSGQSARSGRG